MLVAGKYSRRTEERERERERGEAYRCFDWSMLPAKTTQPITVTAPRNCRVSRFTKTGEGYPFEIPPEVTIPPLPSSSSSSTLHPSLFLFYYASRLILSHASIFFQSMSIVYYRVVETSVSRAALLFSFFM